MASVIPPAWQDLIERMCTDDVASAADLRGCTEAEIAALEAKYGLRLPENYRLYLQIMGHTSGRLFTSDHVAVFYRYVLNLTADTPRDWLSDGTPPPASFQLPTGALIVCSRLGSQYEFIRCAGETDSPLWYFNSWDWQIRESHSSVLDWLETWRLEAVRAIRSGYFKDNPRGTTP